ncbi:hypothetical protein Tco_0423106, partial [Tanacetum coccineum]
NQGPLLLESRSRCKQWPSSYCLTASTSSSPTSTLLPLFFRRWMILKSVTPWGVKRDRTFEFRVNLGSKERVFWGPSDSIAEVMEGMRDNEIDRFLDDNSSIV